MAGYLIVEIEVTDQAAYDRYRATVGEPIARYGGKFLVRGGRTETLEGGWTPKRFVIVEFPSLDRAREFYHSPEYADALKLRLSASRSKAILAEGI
jgi:uncharacterized protein (DUF1330 family)